MKKHNFKYGVESVKNKGTKFYFYISKANEFKKWMYKIFIFFTFKIVEKRKLKNKKINKKYKKF